MLHDEICSRRKDGIMSQTETLHRRGLLKALLGLTAVAVGGGVLLGSGSAEAAPLPKPEIAPEQPDVASAKSEADLPETDPVQYYYRRRVYRRRYVRRVYRRPVYRRRVYRRRRVYFY
jgi:hypothetical protein